MSSALQVVARLLIRVSLSTCYCLSIHFLASLFLSLTLWRCIWRSISSRNVATCGLWPWTHILVNIALRWTLRRNGRHIVYLTLFGQDRLALTLLIDCVCALLFIFYLCLLRQDLNATAITCVRRRATCRRSVCRGVWIYRILFATLKRLG